MKNSIAVKLLVGLIAAVFINTASAHSFNLVFIAPITTFSGQSALNGFLLATREQDSHENEDSDGHLGGLDSYVFRVDSEEGESDLLRQLNNTIGQSNPIFATGLDLNNATLTLLENNTVLAVDPTASRFWVSLIKDPNQLKLINGKSFTSAFRQSFGHDPDLQAIHGYLSARIIATVVRNSDEQMREDTDEIKRLLDDVLAKSQF